MQSYDFRFWIWDCGFRIPGFQDSRIPRFQDSRIPGFNSKFKIQGESKLESWNLEFWNITSIKFAVVIRDLIDDLVDRADAERARREALARQQAARQKPVDRDW